MNNVRIALHQELKERYDKVYFQNAEDGAEGAYATYEFYLSDGDPGEQLIFLEIDGWDENEDTTDLEEMMTDLDLEYVTIQTEKVTIVLGRTERRPLDEDNNRVKRRKYSYQGLVYERST